MPQSHVKVAISGAAGQIGYALLFRIANGDMFGPQTSVDLHLLELPHALPALRGIVMELEDCAFPLLRNIVTTDDLKTAMRDINWAVLVGSVPRKAGMERSDLLKINGSVFTQQGKAINDNADDDVRVFVVGNPCNTNCLIAMHSAPDIPRNRFYAMTLLDENRARTQLAQKAGVLVSEVSDMAIWGNHSSTQYPDFYHAKIRHQPVTEVISDLNWLENDFINTVQTRGAAVIKERGASSAGSAANAALGSVYRLIHDTPADDCYSICVCSQGEYGIDEGLIFSFPSRTRNGQHEIITGWEHSPFGQQKIQLTLEELRAEKEAVSQLKLI